MPLGSSRALDRSLPHLPGSLQEHRVIGIEFGIIIISSDEDLPLRPIWAGRRVTRRCSWIIIIVIWAIRGYMGPERMM
jgi:hypothetical protein